MTPLLAITNGAREILTGGFVLDKEPRIDGSSLWVVAAGMGPPDAELVEFIPRDLTIKQGETVVWTASRFHAVVFSPNGQFPGFYLPSRQGGELGVSINPAVLFPINPGPEFDETRFVSSGLMGYGVRPAGVSFSLTFTEPGSHTYVCPIHAGMVGTVTVEPG